MKINSIIAAIFLLINLSGCSTNSVDSTPAKLMSLDDLNQQELIIESVQVVDLNEYFDEKSIVYKIRYQSDECEVIGYVGAPVDYKEKEYPILIYNRGGNQEFGKLVPNLIADYARYGYIVLASQYRGVDGGTGKEQFGGDEINDVLKLIDISEDFDFSQKGGVYMAGHSRGGMTTYIACRKDDRIKAAAIFAGMSNAIASYNDRGDMRLIFKGLVGGTPDELPEEYENRSAVMWADEINVPLLIVHGGVLDWRVDSQQSKDMAAALEKCNKEYNLVIYDKADHSLNDTGFMTDMVEWFAKHPIK